MIAKALLLVAAFFAVLSGSHAAQPRFRLQQSKPIQKHTVREDLLSQCDERWRDATLDHFSWAKTDEDVKTFQQRYFVCDRYWNYARADELPGPIFFYLGNEADVLLYLNHTGMMWETAPAFSALIVFAEHRYYGQSLPFNHSELREHMGYLTAEQALADYAELVGELKTEFDAADSPVIGFGGSYGGMLASWMRMKYPHVLDGAIAGSAPIWAFMDEVPAVDPSFFAKGVTYDATEAGGSSGACADNVRKGWKELMKMAETTEGRAGIATATRMCDTVELESIDDVYELRNWLKGAWDYMAMGNYPYPSSYILNGDGELPAYPVREACRYLEDPDLYGADLLEAMTLASGVFYNYTGDVTCFDIDAGVNPDTEEDGDFWDWQACTEMLMPFAMTGESDMFWPENWTVSAASAACQAQWGVSPRPNWATDEWGGKRIHAVSNIVFSNGLLDPWHGAGVLTDITDTLVAVVIPEGAHHLDLMFSHPDDPESVKAARAFEVQQINDWITEAHQFSAARKAGFKSIGSKSASGYNVIEIPHPVHGHPLMDVGEVDEQSASRAADVADASGSGSGSYIGKSQVPDTDYDYDVPSTKGMEWVLQTELSRAALFEADDRWINSEHEQSWSQKLVAWFKGVVSTLQHPCPLHNSDQQQSGHVKTHSTSLPRHLHADVGQHGARVSVDAPME